MSPAAPAVRHSPIPSTSSISTRWLTTPLVAYRCWPHTALNASVVLYSAGRAMARQLPSETPVPFTSRTWSFTTSKRGLIGSRRAAEAVVETLTGGRLEPLPSATMPLGEWRALYPDTLLITGVEIRLTPPTPYDKLRTPKNRHIFIRYKAHACPFKRVSSWNP